MCRISGVLVLMALAISCITACCINTDAEAREWNARGETAHTMGQYEEAVHSYDTALAFNPLYGEALRNRGLSLSLINRTAESEESYQKALTINPNDLEARYFQALSRYRRGDLQGALESLDRSVAVIPGNRDDAVIITQAWTLRGDLFTKLDRNEEANQSYHHAHETMMSTI